MRKGRKRRPFQKRLRNLERRIALVHRRIEEISSFIENPVSAPRRPEAPRRDGSPVMSPRPDRRLASFLSTGSFQSVDMRRHERRNARRRKVIFWILLVVLLIGIYLYFW